MKPVAKIRIQIGRGQSTAKRTKKSPPNDHFASIAERRDLKSRAIKSGGISVLTRILVTFLQMGSVVILSRLLTPQDFGLVAMVTAFTNLFIALQDIGLTDATIQAPDINHSQVSTLFWINMAFSSLITLFLIMLAPVLSWFYRRHEVTLIMICLSFSFIFWGLGTQHIALLKRNMRFGTVATIDLASNLAGTVISIVAAVIGFGYWAIVIRTLSYAMLKMLLTWSLCTWRPSRPRKNTGARPLLKFGLNSVGYYIINYFGTNLDKTIVGKISGAEQLGYYSRAYYLTTAPSGQLTGSLFHVAASTLSKLRTNPADYRRYYLKAISTISFIGMPASVLMVVMSREIVLLLLGPQWGYASKIFSILGLSAGMNILYSTNGWIHVSLGRSDRWMRWGLFSTSVMVAGFGIGSLRGSAGIAAAYTAITILLTFPAIAYAGKPIGLRLTEVIAPLWKSILSAALAGLLLRYLKPIFLSSLSAFAGLTVAISAYAIAYLGLMIILYGGNKPIKDLFSLSKILLSRKRA